MENIIEIRELKKSFKDVEAVRGISFSVRKGELFSFLGVNGAGKSTTISVLCGGLKRDGGEVFIDGEDVESGNEKIKREIGVVFQQSVLDKDLTVRENLEYRAACYGMTKKQTRDRIEELSELLCCKDILKRPVGKLSGGQRRKADVARALLHRPKLLILDEPTTGLDPQTRQLLWQVVATLRKTENLTVLLTTHYMEEAAESDYVVILDRGRIVAQGTPIELKNAYTGDFMSLYGVNEEDVAALGLPYEKINGGLRVSVKNTAAATELILRHPRLFTDYEIVKGKMDDVFLAVTGKKAGGEENA